MNPNPIDPEMQRIIEFYKQDADRPYREAEEPMSLMRLHFLLVKSAKTLQTHTTTDAIRRALIDLLFDATPAGRVAVMVEGSLATGGYENRDEVFTPDDDVIRQMGGDGVLVEDGDNSKLCMPLDYQRNRIGFIYAESSGKWKFDAMNLRVLEGLTPVLAMAFEHAAQVTRFQAQNSRLQQAAAAGKDLIGKSPVMMELSAMIAKAAAVNSNVLILGESGTGKELVAGAIHHNSSRRSKMFLTINCAAIPENLLEAQLFGYEKGAFTGATEQKIGDFELASGGTVFLDEVIELSPALQAKLLRAIQEKEIRRLGGNRTIRVDIRLIAATNGDLEAAIANGRFREDLYYRLNVLRLRTPPLRERREDIPLLARHFIRQFSIETGKMVRGISHEAEKLLIDHDWPGNVRELQNAIERAIAIGSSDVVRPEDLPGALSGDSVPNRGSYERRLDAAKRAILLKEFANGGGYKGVGERLGLNPRSLYRMLRELNLTHLLQNQKSDGRARRRRSKSASA